jgi:squalene-hopene/tetraprenyl-beta-curcumene cyclase
MTAMPAAFQQIAHEPFSRAIARAQANLLRLQRPDGHWCGELLVDSTLCSDLVAYLHWAALGRGKPVDAALQEKCEAHIRRRQLGDGGWNIYEGGPSEINATVKAYFALKLAGHAPTQPYMQEARAAVLRLGGIPRMNTYSKLYLALLGQFPWDHLPTVPPEMVLFPRWMFFNVHELSSWTRAMLMPLAIINHFRPTRAVAADKALHELYPVGTEHSDLRPRWRKPRLSWPNFFLACDRMLKCLRHLRTKPFRKLAMRRCEAWMVERIGEGSDGLAAIFPAMLNSLIALQALGYADDHPVLTKARRDFEGLFVEDPQDFRIQPCLSPVWDTAIATIALAESGRGRVAGGGWRGEPSTGEASSEEGDDLDGALDRAKAWLAEREVRFRGDWAVKNPAPEPSGWAFEYRNDYYPDTDDTMMVLMALDAAERQPPRSAAGVVEPGTDRSAGATAESRHSPQFERALKWLLSFQCRDGGWAAFDKDVTQRWLQDVPFADHNAILDPSCADLTGRVLELLGKIGYARDDIRVRRALGFLRKTQEPDGSWWGRWGVNYLYGTWQVLRGLAAIGQDTREPWIARARDWLESCQNEDGGWGETCASYEDAKLKGKGPSTPSQTAWAVMGLLAALVPGEHPQRKSIRRGIEWLIERQNADGSWSEPATTGTGFPSVFYLKYDMYRNTWPLLALAQYGQCGGAGR